SPLTGKVRTMAASNLLTVAGPDKLENKGIIRIVSDAASLHILAYDTDTKVLRDAPLPNYTTRESLRKAMNHQSGFEENLEETLRMALQKNDAPTIVDMVDNYQHLAPEIARRGYPADLATDILEKLLEHDQYPTNVFVSLSENASQVEFVSECHSRGITARF